MLNIFTCNDGRPFGGPKFDKLSDSELYNAHMYVLSNCETAEKYIM